MKIKAGINTIEYIGWIGIVLLLFFVMLGLYSYFGINSNKPTDEPGIIGYVMEKTGDRILVVNPVAKDFSSTGGVKEFYEAIWFSNAPESIEMGDKVKVWYDIVAESYPGQSEVKDIEIVPSYKPEGANLTESEALHNGLSSLKISGVPVVTSIKYDNQTDRWNIEIKDTMSNEIHYLVVSD